MIAGIEDDVYFMNLTTGDLAKVAALITIRSGWSHDADSRKALDALIDAGLKVALGNISAS